jgi:hypothetical protein
MVFVTISNCFARFGVCCVTCFVLRRLFSFWQNVPAVQYFLFYYFFLCLFVCYFAVANEKQAF